MKNVFLALAVTFSLIPTQAYQDRGRSMIITTGGIVASEHPLASQAAAQILAQGGNAIDAAITANACMGVLSPMQCGMGGDLFAIVYETKTGKLYGLNASGWSPTALDAKFLRSHGFTNMPSAGPHVITVPGCVSGWEHLQKKFARKKLPELLAPAIALAENGFAVPEIIGGYWASSNDVKRLRAEPSSAAVFLPDGRPPKVGEVFRNPDVARSLRDVARHGARAFYNGPIAARIVPYLQSKGGLHTSDDFAKYSAEWVTPISTTYHDWTVYELPPNGQGIAALEMLNIMEKFPLRDWGHNSSNALHTMIEAKKLAYADMLHYMGDPRFGKLPIAEMLSKDQAARRAKLLDPAHANCDVPPTASFNPGPDTTYLCTVDKEGNMVSLIQSDYNSFGSALVAPGTGFVLQDRGALFTLEENHPNVLAGHKRPIHTIIPAFMEHGDTRIAFGIMGGWNQSQAHAQFVADIVDFNLNIQKALEAPRFTKITFEGCDVRMESRFPSAVFDDLKSRGHKLLIGQPFESAMGCGQAVLRDFSTKVNFGASDPRKDGAAIPEPPLAAKK
jgi:gamma-glutamyltranspeptidase/glutathione hydrolase